MKFKFAQDFYSFLALLFLTLSFALPTAQAQNVDYTAWIYQFTSWEGGTFGPCWESGTEEYTRNGWIRDNQFTTESSILCQQCNNNGNCTSTGTWATRTRTNATVTQVRVRIDAWEDDGTRCSYGGGDDCHTTGSTWTTLNPVEYQNTRNDWNTGNGSHRAYARCDYRYSSTTIPNAVDNTSFGFTTGGNRPFWGSLGAWATNGGDCATSGTITHNQTSSFSTVVNCIDQITFRWNVSSETNYDFLRFYINGVEQDRISGTPGWATRTYSLDPNIDNTLEWRYTKDGSVSSNLDRGFVDQITYRNYTIPTVGTSFGANQWNVSCYNGRNLNLTGVTYRGYYVENNLNINTTNHWASGSTPSNAASYDGCSVGVDNHTFVHKRQGFPCGIYNLNVTGHDDEIRIYVNGAQVWSFIGCCTNHGTVWTGYLTASSTIEIRVAEGGGGSNLAMNLADITPAVNSGAIAGAQTICPGGNPTNLSSSTGASGGTLAYTGTNYQWQQSTINCSTGFTNIGGATGASYNPPADPGQTTYYRRRITDACGTVQYSNCIVVTRNTNSTAPTISTVAGMQCPNTTLALSASGGTAGTGSSIQWYSGPNGTGTLLGTGNSISIAPNTTTTYYVRRTGTCNTSSDDSEVVNVRDYIYSPVGTTASVGYCTDDAGWKHFYDAADRIIFSIEGDFSGVIGTPSVSIVNNGTYYQNTAGAVGSCANGWNPGEEQFEMQRSWNVDYTGTLNPPYNVRYYFPASEKTAIETAAANHMAANIACNYMYKYANPNGFYWFKNTGSSYTAPTYDQPTHLTGSGGTVNGVNYSQITGITSFSGGAGGVILVPSPGLPVEFSVFKGWNEGKVNVLEWITETETNSAYFEVERMAEGETTFKKIGEVAAAGNSVNEIKYLFEDHSPMMGVNYYRLKQVDLDASFTHTKVIAIEVDADELGHVFYPNPTVDHVLYQFYDATGEEINIQIIDMLGQVISSTNYKTNIGANSLTLNFESLPAGAYLVVVRKENKTEVTQQTIVKQRN